MVSVIVPDEYLGFVIGDLTSRRGLVKSQEVVRAALQVTADVPLSEMFGYATDLRSGTQGRGQYTMEPSPLQRSSEVNSGKHHERTFKVKLIDYKTAA